MKTSAQMVEEGYSQARSPIRSTVWTVRPDDVGIPSKSHDIGLWPRMASAWEPTEISTTGGSSVDEVNEYIGLEYVLEYV